MGRRGPLPDKARRALTGTGKPSTRSRKTITAPDAGAPPAPAWLSDQARAEWDSLVPVLLELGTLTAADGHALALLADALATYRFLSAELMRTGATVPTKDGVKANPAGALAGDAWRRACRMMLEFGLTPAARNRVAAPPESPEVDPLEQFIADAPSR